MAEKMTPFSMSKLLDWAYDRAVSGNIPGMMSAQELANQYLSKEGTLSEKVDSLIRWQAAKTGTAGFLSGLGGGITLPVTVPTELASCLLIEIRMIAAIAYMGGYDLEDDRVRTLVYICLLGHSARPYLAQFLKQMGMRIAASTIQKLSAKILARIRHKVGERLAAKIGKRSVTGMSKLLPVVGGIVSGSVNMASTFALGKIARETFITRQRLLPMDSEENAESPAVDSPPRISPRDREV